MKRTAYPLLKRVAELYQETNLENVLLLASQHILAPQQRMFELLLRAGLKPENCIIVGKSYSTNAQVLRNLQNMGCIIAPFSRDFEPLQKFDSWFEEQIEEFLQEVLSTRRLENYRKVIILDDGGFMHLAVNRLEGDLSNVVGIEQTSSGHRRIQDQETTPRFPTISVARSHHKLRYESPFIGENGCRRIIRHIETRNKTSPNALVIGLGPIGRKIAGQLFIKNHWNGFATDLRGSDCWDIISKDTGILLNRQRKIIHLDRAREMLSSFDVIIGCAGSPVFSENDIPRLHPEASLVSVSSSDREFPAVPFRYTGGKIHNDYWLEKRCLVNGGFPITFDGKPHAMPSQQIEFTIALLLIHLMDEASNNLHPLAVAVEQIRSLWNPLEGADEWYKTLNP